MKYFTFIKQQQFDSSKISSIYSIKILRAPESCFEIVLQYYCNPSAIDGYYTFDKSMQLSFPIAIIHVRQEKCNNSASFEYSGSIKLNIKTDGQVRNNSIENFNEIEVHIKEDWNELKRYITQ